MRRSLIIYLLLLPLLLASSVRIAAAVNDAGASSPWSNPVATASEMFADDNGVSIDNLFTAAPRFDFVASCVVPKLGLADWTGKDTDHLVHPPMFLLNHMFLI